MQSQVSAPAHPPLMPARERAVDRAAERAHDLTRELGRELRLARTARGLAQAAVAGRLHVSGAQLSRVERGLVPGVSVGLLVRAFALVGCELVVRPYPTGSPLRDAAHLRLLARLQAACSPEVRWRREVPLPIRGDLRAWDAVLRLPGGRVGVEAETRPRDLQELLRRARLKQRDGRLERLLLLLADTRANRALVGGAGDTLGSDFPVEGRVALRALAEGRLPAGDAIVLL